MRGFTLVEILLALGILALISSVMILSFTTLSRGSGMQEGAIRMEAAIRMARADAANTGKRFRFTFDKTSNSTASSDTSSSSDSSSNSSQADPSQRQSLTFYPDGSCDSAVIELANPDSQRDGSDDQRAILEIDGTNGNVNLRLFSSQDSDDSGKPQAATTDTSHG